jgi:hypothetical protein
MGFNFGQAKTGLKDFSEKMGVLPPSAWQLKYQGVLGEDDASFKQVVPGFIPNLAQKDDDHR